MESLHKFGFNDTSPKTNCLVLAGGSPGVDELGIVVDNPLDQTFRLEVGDCASSEGSVNLHSVDKGRDGDDSVSWDFLDDSVAAIHQSLPSQYAELALR